MDAGVRVRLVGQAAARRAIATATAWLPSLDLTAPLGPELLGSKLRVQFCIGADAMRIFLFLGLDWGMIA